MSTTTNAHDTVNTSHTVANRAQETKPSFKTTELIVYIASVVGVLLASFLVDGNEDGQGFGAYQGWFLVTLLTIGYLVSRGLAKSGSRNDR